jgi:tRNA (guanine-N1)-methyltransferase
MKIDVLTLFPEFVEAFAAHSIIGRARDKNAIEINIFNIRDYAANKHRSTDDYPYGGGAGMVMSPQPLADAIKAVRASYPEGGKPKLIYFSPKGRVLTQAMAREFSREDGFILLCGHYEGIDQRIIDRYVDEEISIGDYVLTGGELPAMVFIDCVHEKSSQALGLHVFYLSFQLFGIQPVIPGPKRRRPVLSKRIHKGLPNFIKLLHFATSSLIVKREAWGRLLLKEVSSNPSPCLPLCFTLDPVNHTWR